MTTNSPQCIPTASRPIHAIMVVTTVDGTPATVVLKNDAVGHSMANMDTPAGFGPLMAISPIPHIQGPVEHIHTAVQDLLTSIDTHSSAGDEESLPVTIHPLTEQEAHLVRLLRTCHAHRTATTHDHDDFLRADALTRFVMELLDGCTVEFIQSVFTEATETIQKTTVFSTAAPAYQEHWEQVDQFHGHWLDHQSAAKV